MKIFSYSDYMMKLLILLLLIVIDSALTTNNNNNNSTEQQQQQQNQSTKNNDVAFQNLCESKQCSCTNITSDQNQYYLQMDCSHRLLKEMPIGKYFPQRIRHLDLSMNNITIINRIKFDDLDWLSLAINGIREIDPMAFNETRKLISLDLSYNELNVIPNTLLQGLDDLLYLNLSYNHLKFLPIKLFQSCRLLNELNLAHNSFSYINPDTFIYTSELEILNLAHNGIYSIASGLFYRLEKLERLDLTANNLQSVPTEALHLTKKLQFIDLSENSIVSLNEASFYGLSSLREITLNRMPKLTKIQRKTFSTLNILERLNIEDNPHLSIIDANAFIGIFDKQQNVIPLKYVSFRRNQLNYLAEKMLPYANITHLDLRLNPWNCDCNIRWIHQLHLPADHLSEIRCSLPKQYSGQEVKAIEPEKMRCKNNDHKITETHYLFLLSMFFMTGLFISIFMLIFRDKLIQLHGRRNPANDGSIYYVRAHSEQFE